MTATLPSTRPSRICSPRYATRRRPERDTFGPELARIAEALGQPFMPWQQQVADVGGEINPETGLPAYREIDVTVPRQSGKTTLFLSWQLHRCLSPRWEHPQRSAFTAQSGKDARDKWLDEIYPLIKGSSLHNLVEYMNQGMGNESIKWKTGSLIRLLSTSSSSGHSKTLQQAVEDEIWHDVDDRREQGLRPAMVTIPDAQLLVCSTAGTEASVILNRKVQAGRAAVEADRGTGVAYFEWGAPPGDDWDPEDDESYYTFMPALCPDPPCRCGEGRWRHTVTIDVIRSERMSMDAPEFARAYGNRFTFTGKNTSPITMETWSGEADPDSKVDDPVALAVDVTPDRSRSAIGAVGLRADERYHGELIRHQAGTGWVVDELVTLATTWGPCVLVLDPSGPAGAFVTELQERGFVTDPAPGQWRLHLVSMREYTQACGALTDDVTNDRWRHPDQKPLNDAVEGAITRPLSDAWAWSRRNSEVDISPLVTVTLARYGYVMYAPEWGEADYFQAWSF